MLKKMKQFFFRFFEKNSPISFENQKDAMKIIKKGPAMRVIFFYPGEEGTYVDHVNVILFENGIVHLSSYQEETTVHLQNCEILWKFEIDSEEKTNNVRLLKPKKEVHSTSEESKEEEKQDPHLEDKLEGEP